MSKQAQTAMSPMDTAVNMHEVSKTFTQWRRSIHMKDFLKNILKPSVSTVTALDGISFSVKKGEFVAYAGANGAGKSTTMKLLSGMLIPVSGDISVLGMSPQKDRIRLMKRIGILFGNRSELWWDHPIIQSFEWKRVVWDIPKDRYERIVKQLTDMLDLKPILHTFARELSLGQRMKADLAMMLLHEPELILLDEPTIGLDVLAKRQMIDFLKALNKEKQTTIMVTSHDMDDLEEMADRIMLISKGKLEFDGTFEELRKNAGNMCRIVLSMQKNTPIPGAKLIASEKGVSEYEFDLNKVRITEMLSRISALEGVTDIEIRKAPIEEVIAGLYRQWKA